MEKSDYLFVNKKGMLIFKHKYYRKIYIITGVKVYDDTANYIEVYFII